MKKILVTGSSGYIGRNFINFNNKYIFEKFSLLNQKIEDIHFDNLDVILHFAALVHQKIEYPYIKYHEINVDYPVELAKLAKENGVRQFVFISTIAVYGEEKKILDENTTCNPITSYGMSKLEAEKQLLELNDDSFIVSIIRPPMVYGKNAPGNIKSLVKLVKKIPLIPLAEIHNKRSFISIQNLCHMINEIIIQTKAGVLLASDDEPLSTTELVKHIADALGIKRYLINVPLFPLLLKKFKPSMYQRLYATLIVNNTLTKQQLNFQNPYSTEKGIKLMIQGNQ